MKTCPACTSELRYQRYLTDLKDALYYCNLCGEEWTGRELQRQQQLLESRMRANLRAKLAANRREESGS